MKYCFYYRVGRWYTPVILRTTPLWLRKEEKHAIESQPKNTGLGSKMLIFSFSQNKDGHVFGEKIADLNGFKENHAI